MPKEPLSFEARPRLHVDDALPVAPHFGCNYSSPERDRTPLLKDLLAYTLEKRLQVIEHILCAL